MPYSAVRELEFQLFSDIEACPMRACAAHLHLHRAVGKALPVGAVFHEEVDGAELPRRHAVAARIGIVADPVRVCRRETDADAPLRAHAAVRDNITLDDGAIRACAVRKAVRTLRDVEVDRAVVVRNELAVGADCRPGTARRLDRTAADVDGRGDGADGFVRTLAVWIGAVCKEIDKTVDRDVRLCAIKTVHCLDDSGACLLLANGAQCEHLVLKIFTAVFNMDGAAAIGKERGGVQAPCVHPFDGDCTGIPHMDSAALADGADADDSIRSSRFDGQFLSFEIDIERLCGVDVRDGRGVRGCPRSADHLVRIICTDDSVLGKNVFAVRFADAGVHVWSVMQEVICDGGVERCSSLRGRRIDGRRIDITALTCRFVERNILKTLTCRGRCQPLSNGHLASEVALARRICRVIELICESV